jgi:predicted nuclease of predicted toxin-antitoxin system
MKILIDAQLSPSLAAWINRTFDDIHADSAWSLGLSDKSDHQIYTYAKQNAYVIMSKDVDFLSLLEELGSPPSLIWVTCGNTSNAAMREILSLTLPRVVELLSSGEVVVEIRNKSELGS